MYLGLDLGTSGLKGLLVDDDQTIVAEATAPLTVSRPHPAWSEQHPDDWVKAAEAVLDALSAKAGLSGVRALGLSGQQHGATLFDASDKALRPSILWNDTRAADQAARLDANPMFRAETGNICFAGFTAPKLTWVAENEPEVFAATRRVLLPKDALRLWLTGEAVSDMSDSSGTGWLDVGARDWSDDLLSMTGMDQSFMPRLVEGTEPGGGLRAEHAARWGMTAGIPVAGGGGDNAASAVGAGVSTPGRAFVSLGTSGVLFASSGAFQPAAETAVHTFAHALPDTWHQMGVILAATDALNWYAGLVGGKPSDLTGALGPLQAPGRTLFMPYLGGDRTPINDPRVRGAMIGLEHATDTAAGTRAVLEGVTHAFRDSFDALTASGTTITSLIALGGGSKSDYWLSAIATSLGMPVDVPAAGDFGGAFGAARLAMMADGAGMDIATPPPIVRTVDPDPSLGDAFAEAHARYTATYGALKDLS